MSQLDFHAPLASLATFTPTVAAAPTTAACCAPTRGEPATPAATALYAAAARRMRRGRRLVVSGFAVTVLGIVAYCLTCFTASPGGAARPAGDPAWLLGACLGLIGLGTLLWLIGSVQFFSGAMDSDPAAPDLHF